MIFKLYLDYYRKQKEYERRSGGTRSKKIFSGEEDR